MKTKAVLAVAVVMLALGGVAVFLLTRSPERAACARMADLCGLKGGREDLASCVDDLEQLRQLAGKEAMDKGLACVDHAKSCSEATVCMAGTGLKGVGRAIKGFFEELGKPDK
jgi:hypothetical protein